MPSFESRKPIAEYRESFCLHPKPNTEHRIPCVVRRSPWTGILFQKLPRISSWTTLWSVF